jgi:choloylglycine hydrolase
VRAAFVKENSLWGESVKEQVVQFFHILGAVEQPLGCVEVAKGQYERTLYSSCCDVRKGVYYYKTYENPQIIGIDLHTVDLSHHQPFCYPLVKEWEIPFEKPQKLCFGRAESAIIGIDKSTAL